ncbi:hypothetical protein N1078_18420 [Pseudomonas sp. MIL19]|nr:hypothetical protein [Pseudomonas sp. MIL19]MDD2162538.1 hypothetical protein [Pseudomonas sp. MIL19]
MANSETTETEIICDVCSKSTLVHGCGEQFGVLQAKWGFGSQHDGEGYRVRMCELCFFNTLAYARQVRKVHQLFEKERPVDEHFGRVAQDDF